MLVTLCVGCAAEAPKAGLCEGSKHQKFASLLGGTESDVAFGMTQASDGGYVLVGRTDSLQSGVNRAWAVKTDVYGTFQWGVDLGATSGTQDVVVGAGGRYLVAHGTMKVAAISSAGQVEWDKSYIEPGGKLHESFALAHTPDEGLLVAGVRYQDTSSSTSARDAVLIKVAEDGTQLWKETYAKDALTQALDVLADKEGALVVGWTEGKVGATGRDMWAARVSSTGQPLWSKRYGGLYDEEARAATAAPDDGWLLAGMTRTNTAGDADMWLVRLSADGEVLWDRKYGDDDTDEAFGVAQANQGFIVTGRRNSLGLGPGGLWLLEVDAAGAPRWQMTYGAAWKSQGHAVVTLTDGYAVAGTTRRNSKGSDDFWLLRADLSGEHKCPGALCYGADDLSCGIGLSCDAEQEPPTCVPKTGD